MIPSYASQEIRDNTTKRQTIRNQNRVLFCYKNEYNDLIVINL